MRVSQFTSTGVSTHFPVRRHSPKMQSSPSLLGCRLKSRGLKVQVVGAVDLSIGTLIFNNPV
jgi:hypothetical protein